MLTHDSSGNPGFSRSQIHARIICALHTDRIDTGDIDTGDVDKMGINIPRQVFIGWDADDVIQITVVEVLNTVLESILQEIRFVSWKVRPMGAIEPGINPPYH